MNKLLRVEVNIDGPDNNSLYLCIEAAKELGCDYDSGCWMQPFIFFPETVEEQQEVVSYLNHLELTHHVFT